jgi:hypothetical protein
MDRWLLMGYPLLRGRMGDGARSKSTSGTDRGTTNDEGPSCSSGCSNADGRWQHEADRANVRAEPTDVKRPPQTGCPELTSGGSLVRTQPRPPGFTRSFVSGETTVKIVFSSACSSRSVEAVIKSLQPLSHRVEVGVGVDLGCPGVKGLDTSSTTAGGKLPVP